MELNIFRTSCTIFPEGESTNICDWLQIPRRVLEQIHQHVHFRILHLVAVCVFLLARTTTFGPLFLLRENSGWKYTILGCRAKNKLHCNLHLCGERCFSIFCWDKNYYGEVEIKKRSRLNGWGNPHHIPGVNFIEQF